MTPVEDVPAAAAPAGGEWRAGLFGCFENCGLCIKTFICPCLVFGETAAGVGKPKSVPFFFSALRLFIHFIYRSELPIAILNQLILFVLMVLVLLILY